MRDFRQEIAGGATAIPQLSESLLYHQVVKSKKDPNQTKGIESLKSFQLKSANAYDEALRNKIFFIGQNDRQARSLGDRLGKSGGQAGDSDDSEQLRNKGGMSLNQMSK